MRKFLFSIIISLILPILALGADVTHDGVDTQIGVPSATTQVKLTLGEAFFAGDAGYVKVSDGKAYKTDAGDSDKFGLIGLADTAGEINDSIAFNTSGIDDNQSGLTINEVYYLDDAPVTLEVYAGEASSSFFGYGTGSSYEKIAQSIQEAAALSVAGVKAKLGVELGSPTDDVIVRIETDNSGEPSGVLVHANATAAIDGSTLTGSPVDYLFSFPATVSLSASTKYWVVLTRDTNDTENYYEVYRSTSSAYANGLTSLLMSGTWTNNSNFDLSVTLKASAGTISTTPGANLVVVGRAIATDKILIGDLATDSNRTTGEEYLSPEQHGGIYGTVYRQYFTTALPAGLTSGSIVTGMIDYSTQFKYTGTDRGVGHGNATAYGSSDNHIYFMLSGATGSGNISLAATGYVLQKGWVDYTR